MSVVQTISQYYLPDSYDDNRITLLARDPHWLYAYWDLSAEKKNAFFRDFGRELWEKSHPVLKVVNVSRNESIYIRINDFSNNWYIHVPDSNCLYTAEIGRKVPDSFFINLANSNYTVTPGDYISPNTSAYFVDYRDVRDGKIDLDARKVYQYHDFEFQSQGVIGLSSPELYGQNLTASESGVSSLELSGFNLLERLGVSSDSMIR